jgi:hypothetical protein
MEAEVIFRCYETADKHLFAATDTRAITEEFAVPSVPRQFNEDQRNNEVA